MLIFKVTAKEKLKFKKKLIKDANEYKTIYADTALDGE